MKRLLLSFAFAAIWFIPAALRADEADLLAGKWSVKKVSDQGQNYTQTVEVKKDKFVFQILGADDSVVIHAEGDLKLEKLGPFNSVRFSHIRAGASAANLQDVDEEYVSIYLLDADTWTMAANFDKPRSQKPGVDVYRRVKAAAETSTLVIDEVQMTDTPQSATWYFCFEAKVEGVSRRYYVENKGYDKNQVTIPLALELPKVRAGQKCSFKMQLDDVDADTCTDEMDNRSTGEFALSERGSQTYKPEDHWSYTIRWHLK
jgi:hypothetical protein